MIDLTFLPIWWQLQIETSPELKIKLYFIKDRIKTILLPCKLCIGHKFYSSSSETVFFDFSSNNKLVRPYQSIQKYLACIRFLVVWTNFCQSLVQSSPQLQASILWLRTSATYRRLLSSLKIGIIINGLAFYHHQQISLLRIACKGISLIYMHKEKITVYDGILALSFSKLENIIILKKNLALGPNVRQYTCWNLIWTKTSIWQKRK